MTKQEAIEGHRKMWRWIAKQIEKRKYVGSISELKDKWCKKNEYVLDNECFCCEYVYENSLDIDEDCINMCPLMWGVSTKDGCMKMENGSKGLYGKILHCGNYKKQLALARKIAELQERT